MTVTLKISSHIGQQMFPHAGTKEDQDQGQTVPGVLQGWSTSHHLMRFLKLDPLAGVTVDHLEQQTEVKGTLIVSQDLGLCY